MLLALFGLMTPFTPIGKILNVVAFALVILGIWKKNQAKLTVPLVLGLLIAQLVVAGQLEGNSIKQQLATPLFSGYTTDMRGFLKTYQLMKSGENFYSAFVSGMAGLRDGVFRPDINAWRQPLIFYLWKILPGNGSSIYYAWEIVIIFDLLAAYGIARKFLPERLTILSPFILFPYFHFSLVDFTLLQPEWWAMSFLLFGVTSIVYRRHFLASIFLALSLATREPFIIPVLGILFVNRKNIRQMAIPLLVFGGYYFFFHLPNVFKYPTEIVRSNRHGGVYVLHSLFAYGSWSYLLGVFRPFLILLILGFRRRNFLFMTTYLPFLIFAAILAASGGIDETRDYWGIYFVPFLLVSAPILILPPGE